MQGLRCFFLNDLQTSLLKNLISVIRNSRLKFFKMIAERYLRFIGKGILGYSLQETIQLSKVRMHFKWLLYKQAC
jgi:hypothetical protein